MANEKEKAVTPAEKTTTAAVITGKIRSNPEQGRNGYQQTVWVEDESLTTLNAEIARRRAKGEFGNSPVIVYGTQERGYYVYVPVAADIVANPKGSGRQVGDTVTVSLADRNGWARIMASVSADIKAKNDAKKAIALAAEAEQVAEMKKMVSAFSKLGLNKTVVALQLLSQQTGGSLDVAKTFTALQGDTPTPVSRSSRLAAANGGKMEQPITSLHDPEALKGNEELSGN